MDGGSSFARTAAKPDWAFNRNGHSARLPSSAQTMAPRRVGNRKIQWGHRSLGSRRLAESGVHLQEHQSTGLVAGRGSFAPAAGQLSQLQPNIGASIASAGVRHAVSARLPQCDAGAISVAVALHPSIEPLGAWANIDRAASDVVGCCPQAHDDCPPGTIRELRDRGAAAIVRPPEAAAARRRGAAAPPAVSRRRGPLSAGCARG